MNETKARELYTLISIRQSELEKDGMDRSEARLAAQAELATQGEISEMNKIFGSMAKGKNRHKKATKKDDKQITFAGRYRMAALEHDVLPPDDIICMLCDISKSTPRQTRYNLEKEGFSFEQINGRGSGYHVTSRPKRKYTQQEVDAMIEQKLSEAREQITKDIMDSLK